MTMPRDDENKPNSTWITEAKAKLGMRLTVWTAIVTAVAFLYSVVNGKDSLADNIHWAWLAFLAAFMGIAAFSRKVDRQTDYEALRIQSGSAGGEVPAPPPGAAATTVEQTPKKTTTTVTTGPAPEATPVVTTARDDELGIELTP